MSGKDIILYSTGCPRCKILEKKLDEKKIAYTKVTDTETMSGLGISKVPMLSVNGTMYGYLDAVKMVNEHGGDNNE